MRYQKRRARLDERREHPGHDIGADLHASGQVGGDCYDFIELSDTQVAGAVGDASGKGIPGAILMAETQGVSCTR